jgi:hypothetical protein
MGPMVHVQQGQNCTQFIPSYKSHVDDLEWAKAGVVATIASGDSVLALQQRLDEAGFGRVVVKPMGGDKVFFHCTGKEDIWKIVNDAISFFSMLFTDMQKWSGEKCTYERGAWLRLYGVPVHAWNNDFLNLCVSAVGKLIQADESTMEKSRFDFARILVSTTHVEVIKQSSVFFIDGRKFHVNMFEEWGYNLGEDAFLTEVNLDPASDDDKQFHEEDDLD